MLFKRRSQTSFKERIWLSVWPRRSWRRSVSYYLKRVLRLSATPYAIAMGCAVGAFVSVTPLLGFHIAISVAIAWLLRANLVAAGLGTFMGNPLTFPLFWASTFEIGHLLLPGPDQNAPATLGSTLTHHSLLRLWPLLKPMLLGSIPVGLVVGAITYAVIYRMAVAFRAARRARLAARSGVAVAGVPLGVANSERS